MTTTTPQITLLGTASKRMRERLRYSLRHAYFSFSVYRRVFRESGISGDDIAYQDPFAILSRLPVIYGDTLHEIIDESLRVGDRIVDLESSSGTTGARKRRFISHTDDVADHQLLAELFSVCGVGPRDRVACLDTDPAVLMVSFTRAFDILGVEEAYAYCVGPDFDSTLQCIPSLDPTLIVTVPSIMERCLESLERHYAGKPSPRLKKVLFFGEPLSRDLRSAVKSALCVEVYQYYGATETSALGIECKFHNGIHLFTSWNLIEVMRDGGAGTKSQIVVTSLKQKTLPLLRYALGDVIDVRHGECQCDLPYPRAEVLGRVGDSFSVLGVKIHYDSILNALYDNSHSPRHLQLVLTRDEGEKLTIVLPEALRDQQSKSRKSLLRNQFDLDFLVSSKYLELDFSYVEEGYYANSRKVRKVLDRRTGTGGLPVWVP